MVDSQVQPIYIVVFIFRSTDTGTYRALHGLERVDNSSSNTASVSPLYAHTLIVRRSRIHSYRIGLCIGIYTPLED